MAVDFHCHGDPSANCHGGHLTASVYYQQSHSAERRKEAQLNCQGHRPRPASAPEQQSYRAQSCDAQPLACVLTPRADHGHGLVVGARHGWVLKKNVQRKGEGRLDHPGLSRRLSCYCTGNEGRRVENDGRSSPFQQCCGRQWRVP